MKSVGEAMAIGRTFQQAFAKAMRSRELDSEPDLRHARPRRAARPRSSGPAADRYDAPARGAPPRRDGRGGPRADAHRPVVPARAARARARPRRPVRGRALLQGGRHLRGRVRGADAVLLLRLGARARAHEVERGDRAERRDPRLRAEPHRPGDRVRLLLRARRDDRPRVGPRRGDDQLQPGDGLDRLRHVRPPVLRAADARGRARRRRGRAARGRDRPVRRPDAAEARRRPAGAPACRCSARASTRSTSPRTAGASARCSSASATRRRRTRPRTAVEEALARGARRRLPAARAPELRARRPRDGDRLLDATACATTSSATRPAATDRPRDLPRPLPRERDRGRRRRALRRRGRLDRRDHAARRGGRHPLRRLGLRAAAALARPRDARPDPRADARHRARARRRRPAERPVRGPRRRALRDRGQPARVADGAVRLEGDRRSRSRRSPAGSCSASGSRDLGLPADPMRADHVVGQGGGAAVRPLRRRRRAARAGDALDRRGDGHRARLPDRVRQGAGGGRRRAARRAAPSSSRSPTATRPGAVAIAQTLHDLGFRIVATARHGRGDRAHGRPGRARCNKVGEGSPHVVDWIERGEVDLVINTPTGSGARTDGWEIRRAAVARGIPCLTTLSGGLAAARAIAAARQGAPAVLSLQELHGGRARAEAAT